MGIKATITVFGIVLAGLVLAGCEQANTSNGEQTQAAAKNNAALPADLFIDEAPADARSVAEVRSQVAAADEVVVRGRIGGMEDPFVDGAAVFLLADMSMKTCDELHEDECPTPWDYCCEPRDSLQAKLATVQVVDETGKPLMLDLQGRHGLEPKAELTVAGRVVPQDGAETLVLNAERIYVHSQGG